MAIRLISSGLFVLLLYACWLAMMGVHEFGHVLHAWLSGAHVKAVHFGLLEFSRTELSFDPHPQFVAWGGPIWGSLIPLATYGLMERLHLSLRRLLCFFAGFCLIVNGVYIGVGWMSRAGDAGTLLRHGASPWSMGIGGIMAAALGLYLWHRLGTRFGTNGVFR